MNQPHRHIEIVRKRPPFFVNNRTRVRLLTVYNKTVYNKTEYEIVSPDVLSLDVFLYYYSSYVNKDLYVANRTAIEQQ